MKRPWLWRVVAALFFLAFVAVSFIHFRERPPTAELMRFQIDYPDKVYSGFSGTFAVSPDGRHIAFLGTKDGKHSIWLRPLAALESRPLQGTEGALYPFWSPDGKQIVFSSSRQRGLSRMAIDGIGLARLLVSTIPNRPTDWSPDGRFIIYKIDNPRTNMDLWALPLFGDRKPFPIAHSEFGEAQGRVSPDGRWIAYSSDDSGQPEIYVQAFPSRKERFKVSANGGSDPKWRRDGRELFYIAADGKLTAITVKLGEVPEFGTAVSLFGTKISNSLREDNTDYDVSADDSRFVLSMRSESPAQLTVILNWTALLKK